MKRLLCLLFVLGFFLTGARTTMAAEIQDISFDKLTSIVNDTGNKVVILNFFASWCGPCREEIPDLIKVRKEFPESKVVIIGISVDENKGALQKFAARSNFNYPIYRDQGDIAAQLRINSIPRNIVLNGTGDVLYDQVGTISREQLISLIQKGL